LRRSSISACSRRLPAAAAFAAPAKRVATRSHCPPADGFGGCGATLERGARELAKEYRVIVPDLRGHGWSTNPAKTFTHRQSAEDIAALMDHLALRQARAIGFSSGGMTLLHLTTRYSQRIDAMVLVGATTHFPEEARRIMRSISWEKLDTAPQLYRRCSSRGDPQVREFLMQFNAFKDSYDDVNFTGNDLGRIRAKTMIVHGERDAFFPPSIAVALYEGIPNAELWIVPGAGHDPVGGNTMEFLTVWREFLDRDDDSGGAINKP
jgi:pimeloyl-ACP methyl ester carboxylesterase